MSQRQGSRSRRLGAALAASSGALLIAAGTASAATTDHSVSSHVKKADNALHHVLKDVRGNASSKTIINQLDALRAATNAADSAAAHVVRGAHTKPGRSLAESALSTVAGQDGSEASDLTGILGNATTEIQTLISQAVAEATAGQGTALGLLEQLLGQLPTGSQTQGVDSVTQGSTALLGEASQLAQTLGASNIACMADAFITEALGAATSMIQSLPTELESMISQLPGGIGTQLESLLSGLPTELQQIEQSLSGIGNCPANASSTGSGSSSAGSSTTTGSTPVSSLPGVGQWISGIMSIIGDEFSSLTGDLGGLGGSSSSTGGSSGSTGSTATGPLSGLEGLLSNLFGSIPGLSGLSGLGSTGGSTGFGGLGGIFSLI
ncbi:MAG TPA: hypothetical protein VHX88_11340 [Solirubrobacteraceae bacterium]|jgi:hypothetical protein|nr:hypothetical protein [Solirubrobacteraceae bacterium]